MHCFPHEENSFFPRHIFNAIAAEQSGQSLEDERHYEEGKTSFNTDDMLAKRWGKLVGELADTMEDVPASQYLIYARLLSRICYSLFDAKKFLTSLGNVETHIILVHFAVLYLCLFQMIRFVDWRSIVKVAMLWASLWMGNVMVCFHHRKRYVSSKPTSCSMLLHSEKRTD